MSEPPPENKAPAFPTKEEDGFDDGCVVKRRPDHATKAAGNKDAFVERVHRIEVAAAMLLLDELPRAASPITSAAKLKHIAEDRWPTIHGYVSEKHLIDAAITLGIPVKDGHVAVRLPSARQRRRETT
jgi:hypothetical protein